MFLFLPYDDGHFERDPVHVDDDAKYAVEHAQGQRKLEQEIDAGEQFHAGAVDGPEVADIGDAERGYADWSGRAGLSATRHSALPPRVFSLVHQCLDVVVQDPEPEIQGYAHQVEKLLDHDACDVRQRRKQADQLGRRKREPIKI